MSKFWVIFRLYKIHWKNFRDKLRYLLYNFHFYYNDDGDNIHSLHTPAILVVELRDGTSVSFAVGINKYA